MRQWLVSLIGEYHWGRAAVVASVLAAAVSWITGSLLALTGVTVVIAVASIAALHRLTADMQFLTKALWPPTPVTMRYEFWCELSERAWETLGLTAEESAAVNGLSSQPIGFVVEKWGRSFTRWRLRAHNPSGLPEQTIDLVDHEGNVVVWQVKLEAGACVELVWHRYTPAGGFETLTLAAFGGRFGGEIDPLGYSAPNSRYTLFEIHLPLDFPRPGSRSRKEFAESTERYRVRGKDAWVVTGSRSPFCDAYRCDAKAKSGFSWYLVREDRRRLFGARVVAIQQQPGDVTTIHIKLVKVGRVHGTLAMVATGPKVHRATADAIEPDTAGRSLPVVGELVTAVFDDDLERAERIWLSEGPLGTNA